MAKRPLSLPAFLAAVSSAKALQEEAKSKDSQTPSILYCQETASISVNVLSNPARVTCNPPISGASHLLGTLFLMICDFRYLSVYLKSKACRAGAAETPAFPKASLPREGIAQGTPHTHTPCCIFWGSTKLTITRGALCVVFLWELSNQTQTGTKDKERTTIEVYKLASRRWSNRTEGQWAEGARAEQRQDWGEQPNGIQERSG